jgi:glucosamine--fructose-6-phosphate aminotransferase (isomerizing)
MSDTGTFTHQEILSQPQAWAAALAMLAENRPSILAVHPEHYAQILYTGCGSTYYLAMAAAALTQALTGRPARALPASELWLYPASAYTAHKTLLIAVSRSGETTETLRACEAFLADQHGDLLTLSCYPEMPLAKLGRFNLVLPSGQEQSIAQTRAFSTLYLGTVALVALWAGRNDLFSMLDRLPEVGAYLLKRYSPVAAELGHAAGLDRFYFLGSGPRHGLACELSLKMKEMSLSHSEPFHFMEFRHGPKSMVTPSTLIYGLRSASNAPSEAAVLADLQSLGGQNLVLGESEADVCFDSGLPEAVSNVLFLPIGQMLAFERAMAKGLNPDQPHNLDGVVRL